MEYWGHLRQSNAATNRDPIIPISGVANRSAALEK